MNKDLTHAWETIPCDKDLDFVMTLRKRIWNLERLIIAAKGMHCTDGKVMNTCGSVCGDRQIAVCILINELEKE